MGEAFIWYRGRNTVDPELLKPTVITNNGNYNAPVTGTYKVYCVGGGGGGGGGCRNAQNVSQVFYGAAGTRGTLASGSINLNQGDLVACTLGAGGTAGTNNTTRTSYTNGTYNSRGTSGTSGGATSFGSYLSGAGGTYGAYSWSRTYWSNSISSWNNGTRWNNTNTWNNNNTWLGVPNSSWTRIVRTNEFGWSSESYRSYPEWVLGDFTWLSNTGTTTWYIRNFTTNSYEPSTSAAVNAMRNNCFSKVPSGYAFAISNNFNIYFFGGMGSKYYWHNICRLYINSKLETYNTPIWNNRILTTATRLYTSIQVGSWWYLNNNTITTSGTRIYKGDGGNSGVAGNAGYILVVPPQS